jgi:hypothetical protein
MVRGDRSNKKGRLAPVNRTAWPAIARVQLVHTRRDRHARTAIGLRAQCDRAALIAIEPDSPRSARDTTAHVPGDRCTDRVVAVGAVHIERGTRIPHRIQTAAIRSASFHPTRKATPPCRSSWSGTMRTLRPSPTGTTMLSQ